MRRTTFAIAALAAVAVFAAPRAAQAQVTLGPTAAFHGDFDFGIGATVAAPLDALGEGFGLLADFLYFFPEGNLDYLELNGNVTYDLPLEDSPVMPFVLGGLNIARASVEAFGVSASNTEIGLNVGGGIEFDAGSFRPTVGARFELSGGEGFVIWGTLPFALGEG